MRRIKAFTSIILVTLCTSVATVYAQTPLTPTPSDGMDHTSLHLNASQLHEVASFVTSQFHKYKVPGGAIAIVDNGKLDLLQGIGVSNITSMQPVTPNTQYAIGSLTKSLTAAEILQLRDNGLLSLSDSVQTYLPWFRVGSTASSPRITIYQLLTHTSGIPATADEAVFRNLKPDDTSIEAGVRALESVQLDSAPGTHFEYSNMNYAVLGLLIEKISGHPYDEAVKESLLKPLGMAKATFEPKNGDSVASRYLLESGHTYKVPPLDKRYTFADPAGSRLVSSVGEFSRYVEALLGDGPVSVLSSAALKDSFTGGVKLPGGQGGDSYGFGWVQSHANGSTYVWHNGITPGSYAMAVMVPSKHVGAIVFAGASGVPTQFCVAKVASILTSSH